MLFFYKHEGTPFAISLNPFSSFLIEGWPGSLPGNNTVGAAQISMMKASKMNPIHQAPTHFGSWGVMSVSK